MDERPLWPCHDFAPHPLTEYRNVRQFTSLVYVLVLINLLIEFLFGESLDSYTSLLCLILVLLGFLTQLYVYLSRTKMTSDWPLSEI